MSANKKDSKQIPWPGIYLCILALNVVLIICFYLIRLHFNIY